MKGRVLEVTKRHIDKMNKDIYDVNVQEGNVTIKYQVWDAAIQEMQGKEIEYTVKPAPEGTTYPATLILPKSDKRPFVPRGGSPEQIEAMILSYRKDCMLKAVDVALTVSGRYDVVYDGEKIAALAVKVYGIIGKPLFMKEEK